MIQANFKKISSSLIPFITTNGSHNTLGTAFLVKGTSNTYLVASEHETASGKTYHCVLPDTNLTAVNAQDPSQWIPLKFEYLIPESHQVILTFQAEDALNRVLSKITPVTLDDIIIASNASPGEELACMGFWARNPDLPAAFRKGVVSTKGSGDFLADLKIVRGNSGAPIWRLEDGKILGTAQKNLFDTITLDKPIGGANELNSYADLIVVTSLDSAQEWILAQP